MLIVFYFRLQRFEKTNEMLTNCNALTMSHLKSTSQDLKKHSQMLTDLRKDLDSMFKRISSIKTKVESQYPDCQKSKYILQPISIEIFVYCVLINCIGILEEKQKELEQRTIDSSSSGSASTVSPYNSDTN